MLLAMTDDKQPASGDPTPDYSDQPDDTTQLDEPSQPEAEPKQRWRDRSIGFTKVVAVAAAGLLLGGAIGGTAVALASGDHRGGHDGGHGDRGRDQGRHGPGHPGMDDRGGPGMDDRGGTDGGTDEESQTS